MADPIEDRERVGPLLTHVAEVARTYLESVDHLPAGGSSARDHVTRQLAGPLPEDGESSAVTLNRLLVHGPDAAAHSAGPRFFHFVTGGSTPAALAADWFASTLDNNAGLWISSPLGSKLEQVALGWLKDLFRLPADWGAVLTAGATMSNFTGLAAARQWWSERQGVNVAERGMSGLPAAGQFDPIASMANLAHQHHAWLHVDGAFGLFARLSPITSELAEGVELADSVISDGHKWLNVPYDCGFAFVRDAALLNAVFGMGAPYFPTVQANRPDYLYFGPEMSRRARSLAVWATLAAYGRNGYRAMVERHVALARRVADQIRSAPDFELLEEPRLNVVCFRYRPPGIAERQLDDLNRRLGEAIIHDARVFFGTTVYAGKVAFRPAISNWRTTESDVDQILIVARELAGRFAVSVHPLA